MAEGPQTPQEPHQGASRPGPPRSNGGLVHASSALAEGVLNSFRSQPLMLLVLVLNVSFLVLVHLGVNATGDRHHQEMTQLLEKCFPNGAKR